MDGTAALFDADAAAFTGTVEVLGVIFTAEDDGYAVLEVQDAESGEGFALVGPVAHLGEGERAEVSGDWETHARYGRQLKARGALPLDPADRKGRVAYLTTLRHIGPARADVSQRGQVGDPALAVGGIERQRPARLQLAPVARVGLPVAADFGPLALAQVGDRADQGKALARLRVLHLEHRVAVVLGGEDHAQDLDRPGEGGGVGVEERGGPVHASKLAAAGAVRAPRRCSFT